uniref:Smr domain-containing protein n=1 Tax=Cajanus cajan TaxID=3821 RepID=A0A151R629_CAJCA|nr:hypothetical protein KK1_040752 [Cajanus cajan]
MSISARSSLKKMSRAKGQSSGWTAFDLKQRKNNYLESEVEKDPFPAIGTFDPIVKKKHVPAKPFSSVLLPTKNFPPLKASGNSINTKLVSDFDGKYRGATAQEDVNLAIKKLKEQHIWAENSLIDDILDAVNNNIDKASALLKTMASTVNFEECIVSSHKLSDVDNLRCKMNLLNSVPVEPEWEDDDIYISHRKDALKTMRSASRHSRAASSAFLRGDHFSAQNHSTKARAEWYTAEELNSDAAKKILSIRNNENDIWRLDLHATSNGVKENGLGHSTLGSLNFMDREKLNIQTPLRLRSLALHVITGVGNHSRGQAALPTAVRSFLNENRYRFEEMRPGVITVWPKFRQN